MVSTPTPSTETSRPPDPAVSAITIEDLKFRYDPANKALVLDVPRWQVAQGEHVFLFGPSGSGKSTLLNLLGGVLHPEQGSIRLLGVDFSTMRSRRRDRFRAQHLGIVFQQFNLIPYLSVMENIQLARHFAKGGGAVEKEAARLFDNLQLPESLFQRRADSLSVGQQQRVAIARALINEPEILIADEPSSALDTDARDSFMRLLLDVCRLKNSTLLFVSHDRGLAKHFPSATDLNSINRSRHHAQ